MNNLQHLGKHYDFYMLIKVSVDKSQEQCVESYGFITSITIIHHRSDKVFLHPGQCLITFPPNERMHAILPNFHAK